MKNNQKGFGAVEGLLVLILVSILGFTGYYVYHTQNNANSSYNSASDTSQKANQTSSGSTNTTAIKEAVKNDCESTSGNSATDIKITKQEGDYAAATVACGNSTAGSPTNRDYLSKSNGKWNVVLKGGGAPTTSDDLAPYGFPADFLN